MQTLCRKANVAVLRASTTARGGCVCPRARARRIFSTAVVNKRSTGGCAGDLSAPARRRAAAEAKHEISADQSAEVCEVSDTFLGAGHAEEELEPRVQDHEDSCRHGNRRKN